MPDRARPQLASAQAQLLGALVAGAALPAGFDQERVAAAAEALLLKRAGAVARAWPRLRREMNDEFAACFASYARAHPLTSDGSPLADGRAFADWLDRAGLLREEGRLEAFVFDARYCIRADGISARRAPLLRVLRLHTPRQSIIVLRLPFIGERWLKIKFL